MSRRIVIRCAETEITAALADHPIAEALWQALPLEVKAHRWGDEIYCGIPVDREEDTSAREVVEVGDVAYWPPGKALCFFFGPTPISREGEVRAASPVIVLGRMERDPIRLRRVGDGNLLCVERVSSTGKAD